MDSLRTPQPAEPIPPSAAPAGTADALRKFGFALAAVSVCFSLPLYFVFRFSRGNELYSYILLVPVISAYLYWTDRQAVRVTGARLPVAWPATFFVAAAVFLALAFTMGGPVMRPNADRLALLMCAYVGLVHAFATLLLPAPTVRALRFPLGFLIFLAPLPAGIESAIETGLQHASAWTAHQLFSLSGTPVYRSSTYFQLPAFAMQVAPECSGIRSTFALFLTSVVAGHVLLRRPWSKVALAIAVIPIAIARNGFRVYVIGELCVQIGPHMIDSWIHRHGGPVFFALSLIPFGALLYWLMRADNRRLTPA